VTFPDIPSTGNGTLVTSYQANTTALRTFPLFSNLTGKANGDLLIAVAIAYQNTGSTGANFSGWNNGFTELTDAGTSGTTMGFGVAYKWADGTESGSLTVTQAGTITGHCAMILMVIKGAHASQVPSVGVLASNTTAAADPASLNASWGADDNLWISLAGSGETSTTGSWTGVGTTAPTNYTGRANSGMSGDAVGTVEGAVAFRQLNAASEDAGGWAATDISNSRNSVLMLAVRPGVTIPPPIYPPYLVQYAETNWQTAAQSTAKATPSISWLAGDLIVAVGANEGNTASTVGPPTFSGGTFSPWGTALSAGGTSCYAQSWSCVPAADGSGAVSFPTSVSSRFGGSVWVFRNHGGMGGRWAAADTALTLSAALQKPHSYVCMLMADYGANAPSGTWTPAGFVSEEASNANGGFTAYVADWNDQTGTASYGRSAGTSATYSKIVLEIIGGQIAPPSPPTATGAITMKHFGISGAGEGISDAIGAVGMKKMTVAGTGTLIPAGGRLTPSLAAAGTPYTGTTSAAPVIPSGAAVGQTLLLAVNAACATTALCTASAAGWTQIGTTVQDTGSSAPYPNLTVLKRICQAGDPGASVSLTWAGNTPSTCVAMIEAYKDVDDVSTFESAPVIIAEATNSSSHVMGPLTISGDTMVPIAIACERSGSTWSMIAPWQERGDSTTGAAASLAFYDYGGAIAPGTISPTCTSSTSTSQAVKFLGALQGAASGAEVSAATIAIGMKKSSIAGAGAGISVATNGPKMKKMTVAASGAGISVATNGPKMKKMTIASSGAGISVASGGPKSKKMTIAAAGNVPAEIASAAVAVTMKHMTIAAAGNVPAEQSVATGAVGMKKMTVSGAGAGISVASGGPRLKKMSVSAIGTGVSVATGAPKMKKFTVSGAGTKVSTATAAVGMKKMRISGTATTISVASGGPGMKKMTVAATATTITSGSAAVLMKKMSILGTEGELALFSGGPRMKKMGVSAAGAGISVASGGPIQKKMKVSGSGAGVSVASGGPVQKKMKILGTGAGLTIFAGEVTMKKMVVAASGEGIAVVTVMVTMKKMKIEGEAVKKIKADNMMIFSML
jgi:hypothetical protein